MEIEKPFSFIIDLRECIEIIRDFAQYSRSRGLEYCTAFVQEMRYEGIIEETMTAACMYPRSKQLSANTVEELSYVIADSCMLNNSDDVPDRELELIGVMATQVGRILISKLDEVGFYDRVIRFPRLARGNLDYESDSIMQIECNEVRPGVYKVDAIPHAWDEDELVEKRIHHYIH